MARLTLSVDRAVAERAKRYAAGKGTSVSRLVETYLDLVSRTGRREDEDLPPGLARLRRELKGVSFDRKDYHRYLERKCR